MRTAREQAALRRAPHARQGRSRPLAGWRAGARASLADPEHRRPGPGPSRPAAHSLAPAPAAPAKASPRLPANQVLLSAVVAVLTVVGLVMVLSASSVEALSQYGSSWVFFDHQVMWVAMGTVLLVVVSRVDYRVWRRLSGPLLVGVVVLLLAVLVPGLGSRVGGSSRWLGFGSLRFQPSELAKLALAVFGADVLARRAGPDRRWWPAVRPVLIAFAVTGLLILRQPDMGTALVLGCITLGLLYAAGAPGRVMGGVLAGGGMAAFVVGIAQPYRRARLLSFLNPWDHRTNTGYQLIQSLVGFANGHVLGVGLGASRAKWGFLPNAHTDFIFSIIGEELGLVGSLLVVALFVALAIVGLRVAGRAPDRFGSLLAAAITCWLTAQAVLNMGAVIGLLPVTGVPLPFVSYGGSSLAIEMAAVGVMLNIARRGRARPEEGAGGLRGAAKVQRARPPARGR
ncbi:MAG: putative lipid II flippase FtsW [Acidimicrobiales bacterium]